MKGDAGAPEDLWEGEQVDEHGLIVERDVYEGGMEPLVIEPPEQSAAQDIAAGASTPRLYNLPEEFWGARELFKVVRQQARADGTSPDAVLGAVLARASAMVPHTMRFDSGKEGTFNLFVNIVAPSGIGKTEAMRSAQRAVLAPTYLTDEYGDVDQEKFRDGWVLGSGEGMVEIYQGMTEKDTGEIYKYGPNKGDPKTKPVKEQVRHNAFLFLDEGEAFTRMLERKGATLATNLRTMWTGMSSGAANAQETTTRYLKDGSYALGLLIGWQPKAAQALITDKSGGTPQRFLWLSAIDPDMPEEPETRPEPIRLPLCDGHGHPIEGVVTFPEEIKRAIRLRLVGKHHDPDSEEEELHSHEPLMRCKIAANLCLLDGRMHVSPDDWRFAGMIWQTSCAVTDRIVEFGRQHKLREDEARRAQLIADTEATETARQRVSDRTVGYARRIAAKVHRAATENDYPDCRIKRSEYRRNFGKEEKPHFDGALAYAESQGWVVIEEGGVWLAAGAVMPG